MSDFPALSFVQAPSAPETFNVLLYGPPGSGKSTAAATAPGAKLWLNLEGPGALGYARKIAAARGTTVHEVRADAKAGPIKPTLHAIVEHVREGRDPKIDTVVVDTVGKVREGLAKQIVVPGSKNSIQQWGQVAEIIEDFVRAMRDLPVNVVLLAHEHVSDDQESGRIVEPMIGGKPQQTVPGEVDVVGYCGVVQADGEEPRYVAQLLEGRGRRAKDRSGGLGTVRDLDLTEWLATYRAALTPDESDLPFGITRDEPAEDPQEQMEVQS